MIIEFPRHLRQRPKSKALSNLETFEAFQKFVYERMEPIVYVPDGYMADLDDIIGRAVILFHDNTIKWFSNYLDHCLPDGDTSFEVIQNVMNAIGHEVVMLATAKDLLTSTETTVEELKEFGFTDELIKELKILCNYEGFDEIDYLMDVRRYPKVRLVKCAELIHKSNLANADELTNDSIDKAMKALKQLKFLLDSKIGVA